MCGGGHLTKTNARIINCAMYYLMGIYTISETHCQLTGQIVQGRVSMEYL